MVYRVRWITRKYASLAIEFPVGGIQRFNGIGRIDDLSDGC